MHVVQISCHWILHGFHGGEKLLCLEWCWFTYEGSYGYIPVKILDLLIMSIVPAVFEFQWFLWFFCSIESGSVFNVYFIKFSFWNFVNKVFPMILCVQLAACSKFVFLQVLQSASWTKVPWSCDVSGWVTLGIVCELETGIMARGWGGFYFCCISAVVCCETWLPLVSLSYIVIIIGASCSISKQEGSLSSSRSSSISMASTFSLWWGQCV